MKNLLFVFLILFSLSAFSQMRLVENEQFENNKNSWPELVTDDVSTILLAGSYSISIKKQDYKWENGFAIDLNPNDDFIVKVCLKQNGGEKTKPFGLYLLENEDINISLSITSNGYSQIINNGTTVSKEKVNFINPQHSYNTLEVHKTGTSLYYIINADTVFNSSDHQIQVSKVGISAIGQTDIAVDYMEVYRYPKPFEIMEEFDNNDAGWPIVSVRKLDVSMQSGKYIINRQKKKEGNFQVTDFNLDWRNNFTVETKFRILEAGKNNGFGIYMKNGVSNYYYYIDIKNNYYLKKYYWKSEFLSNKQCPVPIQLNNDIILKLEHNDNYLNIYINDQLLESFNYEQFAGNKVGFISYGEIHVEVEYLKIRQTPRPINIVNNSINGYRKVNLGENINSEYNEFSPKISPDGKNIYYVRSDYPEIEKKWGSKNQDIYYSQLNDNKIWSKAENIGKPINNSSNNFVVSVTPDNNSILVGNKYNENGEPDGNGLSVANRDVSGSWKIPIAYHIENYSNQNKYVGYVLAPDKKVLVLCIQTDESIGDKDLYVSFLKTNGNWSEPKHMGSVINSYAAELSPFIASDGKTLYFSSEGHSGYGSADVFITRRLDDTWLNWSTPRNLGPEINSSKWDAYFNTPASGNVAYLSSLENSIGQGDIFKIELGLDAQPDPVVLIKGRVLNSKTNQPLSSEISYMLLKNDEEVGIASSNPKDGTYQIALPYGENYSFMAALEGFYPIRDNIDLSNLEAYTEIERDLYLAPIEKGEVIRLNNLFFEFNSDELLDQSYGELKQLISSLQNNPGMEIEIGGHTDTQGTDTYNLQLSKKRANAVVRYLVERGIDSHRLVAKGYGESSPISANDTEQGRKRNRRVEFRVIEK